MMMHLIAEQKASIVLVEGIVDYVGTQPGAEWIHPDNRHSLVRNGFIPTTDLMFNGPLEGLL